MEIILLEDYPQIGFVGDRVVVRNGYARNFLIPKGMAVECSSKRANSIKQWLTVVESRKAAKKKEAEDLAQRLAGVVLDFKLRMGGQGKSYGSIGAKEIQRSLSMQGYPIDRRQIKLNEPLKRSGEAEVVIKLHSEVTVSLKVHIQAVGAGSAAVKDAEAAEDAGERKNSPVAEAASEELGSGDAAEEDAEA